MIRVFSFYPPKGTPESGYDAFLDEAIARLRRMVELADVTASAWCWKTRRGSSAIQWRAATR